MGHIDEQLPSLPDTPGIYLFYNQENSLIYVGKATSLKNRVKSYFVGKRYSRPIEQLIHEVADIKWKEADSVLEAIILESIAIKKYQPKYNVLGKDNKSWNYIVITKDIYPRVETIRQYELEQMMEQQKKLEIGNWKLGDPNFKFPISNFKYIFGPYPGLNRRATMKLLAQLFHISFCKPGSRRPCLYYEMGDCYGICVGAISPRQYKEQVIRPLTMLLRGQKKKLLRLIESQMKAAAKAEEFEEAARLRNQLLSLVRIHDVALLNKSFFASPIHTPPLVGEGTGGVTRVQGQASDVQRIEGYDISNLGPTGKVGSMVVFTNGEPDKRQYRRFRIRTVSGQSDVASLAEVMERRLNHYEWPLPMVFLIDGGKPQVNRVRQILDKRKITIPVVGIAKGPGRKKNEFVIGDDTNTPMDANVANYTNIIPERREFIRWVHENQELLIRVRDEAHRFAISYQRMTRKIVI